MRHRAPRLATGLLCQALVSFLVGCGGGDSSPNPSPPPPPPADTTPPTVPQGLTATAQSATQIALSWTASTDAGTGVAGYRVFRDAGATAIATVTATNYTDGSLAAGTNYSYSVRAFDAATPANESAASAAASAATSVAPPTPAVSGLDARPANTSCLAGDPPSGASITLQRVFPNLPNFTQPIAMLQAPGDPAHWYVVQKTGQVLVFDNTPDVSTVRTFIDISGRLNSEPDIENDERGLLGMAFHPDWATNRRAFLFYTGTTTVLVNRLSEYRSTNNGMTLAPATALELFNVDEAAGPAQRRQHGLRSRRVSLRRHRRRWRRRRPARHHRQRPAVDDSAGQDAAHRRVELEQHADLHHSAVEPLRRESALQRQWQRDRELPRDLCLWLPQSLALELRPRQRRGVAQRRRPGHDGRGEQGHAWRQLRLALLRGHEPLPKFDVTE